METLCPRIVVDPSTSFSAIKNLMVLSLFQCQPRGWCSQLKLWAVPLICAANCRLPWRESPQLASSLPNSSLGHQHWSKSCVLHHVASLCPTHPPPSCPARHSAQSCIHSSSFQPKQRPSPLLRRAGGDFWQNSALAMLHSHSDWWCPRCWLAAVENPDAHHCWEWSAGQWPWDASQIWECGVRFCWPQWSVWGEKGS